MGLVETVYTEDGDRDFLRPPPGLPSLAPRSSDLGYPLYLSAEAWVATEVAIGYYNDLTEAMAWKYLESDLSVGHEFSQPVRTMASDRGVLHCRILSRGAFEILSGRFEKALDCVYLHDMGLFEVSEGNPPNSLYVRMIDYGRVVYAPGVGPVFSEQRAYVTVGEEGPSPGLGMWVFELAGSSESQ